MKNSIVLFSMFIAMAFISCEDITSNNENEQGGRGIIGLWGDIVQLSTRDITFDKAGGEYTITTEGEFWWLSDYAQINGETVYFVDIPEVSIEYGKIKGWDNPNVIYDKGADEEIKKIDAPWFTIHKDSYKSLVIKTMPNTSGKPRTINMDIQAGNYFDYITISQSE